MLKRFLTTLSAVMTVLLYGAVNISPVTDLTSAADMPIAIGGGGGMHMYVDSGKLDLEVTVARIMPVRVVILTPDRNILADTWFPPTQGNSKVVSKVRITADDLPKGIYSMMINQVQDPLGNLFQWGFTTNCKKYVIENSRGHRDARHTEPITICSGEKKGRLYFPVQKGAFKTTLTKCIPDSAMRVIDNTGKVVASTKADAKGNAGFSFTADKNRKGLWALEFDRFQAQIEQDELTHWAKVKGGEDSSELCHWTNDPASWFRFGVVRKMFRPFYKEINTAKDCEIEYLLYNYGNGELKVMITPEYPAGVKGFLRLFQRTVTIPPKQTVKVKIFCRAPAEGTTVTARLRASAAGVSSYSTLKVSNLPAKQMVKLETPFLVDPFRNASDYDTASIDGRELPTGEPYFDKNGKAYCNNYFNTWYKENGVWHKSVMSDGKPVPRTLSSKIGFDHENRPYLLAKYNGKISLLTSNDGGKTFTAYPLPVPATFADIEVFTGHNPANYLPPVIAFFRTSSRSAESFWRQTNHMTLLLPEIKNGKVVFEKIIPLTKLSIGIAVHSGMAHSVVSVGDNVHIIWGEASDPKDKSIKGVPTYVATYNRTTGKLTKPVLIGFGPPANDVHNTPSIVADSKGYLHAVIGSHGDRFRYTRSIEPNSSKKWLKEEKIAERTSMTYAGLVCDKDDNLYLFYREWPRFQPYGYCAVLALRTKKATDEKWSDYRVIARPFFTDYSVYYHKVTIGPDQKIYVSLNYYSTFWFFRNEIATERFLIESPDGAKNWYLSK